MERYQLLGDCQMILEKSKRDRRKETLQDIGVFLYLLATLSFLLCHAI